jgi:hypothetical protein
MDKLERKKLGAWISLLGGSCFVIASLTAIYVAFFMPPEAATDILIRISRIFR